MKTTYTASLTKLLADTFTPVGLYLRLRDQYDRCFLLESTDHQGAENSYSFICCEPLQTFSADQKRVSGSLLSEFEQFISSIHVQSKEELPVNGIFGYTAFEAVSFFDPSLNVNCKKNKGLPIMQYSFFRFIIGINHFNDELFVIENVPDGEKCEVEELLACMKNKSASGHYFETVGSTTSSLSDGAFEKMVNDGKRECRKGNVFQVVLSREFLQSYVGDEFSVYRRLRNINPSPYLFYYDGGDFRLFGSSPEAQLVVKNRKATIFPIAGTFRRTGNVELDKKQAEALKLDPKENAEHIMLVDLARNDLSIACTDVKVEQLADIQYYSHVIHMVSRVSGKLKPEISSRQLFAATFPAGTLSGAPKHRAMQLIDQLESDSREYYGGAIGYFGFNGDVNHAIIIRSFLSQNNTLYFRAGAGVVIASEESGELQEVNNKLAALRKAIIASKNPQPLTSNP